MTGRHQPLERPGPARVRRCWPIGSACRRLNWPRRVGAPWRRATWVCARKRDWPG